MELPIVISGIILVVFGFSLWVWWKDGRTWQPFLDRIRHRLQSALGVVSREEMKEVQKYFREREQQWETRVRKLETTAKFSQQLQYASKEIERRLSHLELEDGSRTSSKPDSTQQPRSLVRFGVLLTISDALWSHLGAEPVEDIDDHLIETLIQGPFCPICLKRLLGRDRAKRSAELPTQCRHCGASWGDQGTSNQSLSSVDLKRQVYTQLDQEYRVGGRNLRT